MLPCTHITHTDTQALTPIHSLSHPHTHTTLTHLQTEHGGECLELRQDLVPSCFQMASLLLPGSPLGLRFRRAPLHSSVCKVRAVWGCQGGRDGAREGGKLISQEKHANGRHSPAHCFLLEDSSLFITRTEGLGLWGPISPCLHCGQCCMPSPANHEPGRTLQLD